MIRGPSLNRDRSFCYKSLNNSTHGFYQNQMIFYCGKGVNCYASGCTRCDGRCGPNNGCQCEACYELEKQHRERLHLMPELVENPHIMISYDNSARCSPGIPANSLLRYKFYCGLMVGRENYENQQCRSCDGRCGPDNGCQCRACYQLDRTFHSLLVAETNQSPLPGSILVLFFLCFCGKVFLCVSETGGRSNQRVRPAANSQEVEWNPLLLENVLHKNGDRIVEQLKSASSCVSLESATMQLLDALRRRKVIIILPIVFSPTK